MHDKWRLKLLKASVGSMPRKETEICIVELGKEKYFHRDLIQHTAPIKHMFVKNDRPFNRAWAINLGVKHLSEGDLLVLSDADLILPSNALELWRQTDVPAVAWSRLHRLDRNTTNRFLEKSKIKQSCTDYAAPVFSPPSIDSACGGVNVIPREIYFETGGMVEVFEGWGGEDNATWARFMAYGYPFKFLDQDVCHLWHPSRAQHGSERAYVFWMKTWSKKDWGKNINHQWGNLSGAQKDIEAQAFTTAYIQDGSRATGKEMLAQISNNLGLDYINRAMYEDAVRELNQTVSIDPEFASAHMNLAIAYTKKGMLNDALQEYKQALAIESGYGKAHYNLAILYTQMGKHPEAVKHCNKARELGIDVHPNLQELLQTHCNPSCD